MYTRCWWTLGLFASTILTGVSAGRFADVAKRKGYAAQVGQDDISGELHTQKLESRASKRRFYTNETKCPFHLSPLQQSD